MFSAILFAAVSVTSYLFPVIGILVGIAGVAAYLTGSVRKSLAETQAKDIDALDHRIETLEAENALLRESEASKTKALDMLIEQVRGTAELAAITQELVAVRKAFADRTARFDHIDNELEFLVSEAKFLHTAATRNNRVIAQGKKQT